ncbi:MAG: DUF547 domain-containing protein [Sandaracinaceae bacterium]
MGAGDTLRDAWDILRRARGPREVLDALVPGLAPARVLNEGSDPGLAVDALIRALRDARNRLKGDVVGQVDYAALRKSEAFSELSRLSPGLVRITPGDLGDDRTKTAFFINLYNVLAMHGVIALGIEHSVMEIPSFFSQVQYCVGGVNLSLDQMENGVLRANGKHPATGRRSLPADSPALAFCPAKVDPRIHAALVCASTSCPPVGFYDPEDVDRQLDLATENYVNNDVHVSEEGVSLPITFRYYAADWGGRDGIERFLLTHADAPLREALTHAFARRAPWLYQRYDWSLNHI